jgi:hypothetical protein
MKTADFKVRDCGTIALIRPMNDKAHQWVEENIDLAPWQDKYQIALEPRMLKDIEEGIAASGMTIEEI